MDSQNCINLETFYNALNINDQDSLELSSSHFFVDEPMRVELRKLPPHLEYAFLEGDNKLPVIIAKELDVEEKSALAVVSNDDDSNLSHDMVEKTVLLSENSGCQGFEIARWVLILQEFDFHSIDTKGARMPRSSISGPDWKNPYENVIDPKEIMKVFPLGDVKYGDFRLLGLVKTLSFVFSRMPVDIMEQVKDVCDNPIRCTEEVDIIKKAENQAKMTKLSMEWKRLCKIKAKVQKNGQVSESIQRISSQTVPEAKYVSLSACCAQVLWLRTQLTDYGFHFDKIPMYCDSKAVITISCNPVQHSRTNHIDVRYHFIKEQVEKGIVELFFVGTEYQLADIFTKALPEDKFKYLVRRLGMRCLTPEEQEVLANESA
ncbi:hypothetical protein Tco_1134593 [Tanacetum coccineum]